MAEARVDPALVARLLRHEVAVHAVPGREVRELGDALLLYDPIDPEPFWNRLEGLHLPTQPDVFDRRLAELGILFAGLARQPHVWLVPPYDDPPDLYSRLLANGFEDAGASYLMLASAADLVRAAVVPEPGPRVTLERWSGVGPAEAVPVATAAVEVVLSAFAVPEVRREPLIAEVLASLADPRFTIYLARVDGVPAGIARRATFDGLSYLSSIGTVPALRGRGLGRLVTAAAAADAVAAGSEHVHLGVFEDNLVARRLYEDLGFGYVGDPSPDMILTG